VRPSYNTIAVYTGAGLSVDGSREPQADSSGRNPAYSVEPQLIGRHDDDGRDQWRIEQRERADRGRAHEREDDAGGNQRERDVTARPGLGACG
jgi:hypothetical protein